MPNTWKDSVGTNHLTDNNTVNLVYKGPVGTVAQFTSGDADYLEAASPILDMSASVSVAGWMYRPTAADGGIVNVDNASNRPFNIDVSGGTLRCYPNGGYIASLTAPPAGQWAFFCGLVNRQELALGRVHMYLNAVDGTTRDMDGAINATTSTVFRIGTRKAWNDSNSPFQMAYIGVWAKALTVAEQQSLMNGGAGKTYAQLTTADKVSLVAYWNLTEASGDRADSHASYTLTDKNTVQSATATNGSKSPAAASFVAANAESLELPSAFPDLGLGSFSINYWIKGSTAHSALTFGKGDTSSNVAEITLFQNGLVPQARMKTSFATGPDLVDGAWNMTTVVYDSVAGSLTTFTNNVAGSVVTGVEVYSLDPNPFYIGSGRWGGGPGYALNGVMDEFAIWNRVLTADERTALYNSGAGKFYPFT
jgi:hypothetical protein